MPLFSGNNDGVADFQLLLVSQSLLDVHRIFPGLSVPYLLFFPESKKKRSTLWRLLIKKEKKL
ncbi:hypothetical protein CR164_07155 [Prosthecochloris marina]|uniref:Uncharacterized protein n=1 Tax=Prosthecochloris marina TaxID=2017681 RepID=A0A317T8N3_9CHLB|nr:hypothetical protein CR164_07155 [Prosthecochloris marina]